MYLTPKSSTTRVKAIGQVLCDHKPGTYLDWKYPALLRRFYKKFICDKAGVWKAIHSTLGFNMNGAIFVNNVAEVVFVNNFLWNVAYVEANLFRTFHRNIEIKI
jgi:hypothetical protein